MAGVKGFHKLAHHAPHVASTLVVEMLAKVTMEQGYWIAAATIAAVGVPAMTVYWVERRAVQAFTRRRRKRRCP